MVGQAKEREEQRANEAERNGREEGEKMAGEHKMEGKGGGSMCQGRAAEQRHNRKIKIMIRTRCLISLIICLILR